MNEYKEKRKQKKKDFPHMLFSFIHKIMIYDGTITSN